MNYRRIVAGLSACSILAATPASAGESEGVLLGAILGNMLGGKTHLGNGAGEIEGTMISSRLLTFAAGKIVGKAGKLKDDKGILLIGDEDYNLGLPYELMTAMDWHSAQLAGCAAVPSAPRVKSRKVGFEAMSMGVVGDAIEAAPPPSTAITGYKLTVPDSALIAAFQSQAGTNWRRISDVTHIDAANNRVATKFSRLLQRRADADSNGCFATEGGKARIARFDEFNKQITASGEKGGASILVEAERIYEAYRSGDMILRLRVEAAGGSIINSDNLLTRLGLPAVSLTGATVISFRLINPMRGTTMESGLLICVAPKQNLGALQKGKPSDTRKFRCAINGDAV